MFSNDFEVIVVKYMFSNNFALEPLLNDGSIFFGITSSILITFFLIKDHCYGLLSVSKKYIFLSTTVIF
jgi:hypothetical protein